MAASSSKTRPGNPDRGWNDPPMFNYNASKDGTAPPRRSLNQRVAFPMSASNTTPGHAVLNPSEPPPILNPVLPANLQQGPPAIPVHPPIPIGLRDTPLGNQAPPASPVHLLPPSEDISTPQTVPLLVPGLIPSSPPKTENQVPDNMQLDDESLNEVMSRLSLTEGSQLLQHTVDTLLQVLDKYKNILTTKVIEDIKKKVEIFEDKWKNSSLSDIVKVRITQLATALLNEDTDKANHLHLALMVDHIAEVSQWMMGVKRLLQQQQLANKEKEIIAENKLLNSKSESCDQKSKSCDQESKSCDIASSDQGEVSVNDSKTSDNDATTQEECKREENEISDKVDCDNVNTTGESTSDTTS
ncbi:hypothetical protein ACF0H5_010826 [Mactra antiquata]